MTSPTADLGPHAILAPHCWPGSRLHEAVDALARRAALIAIDNPTSLLPLRYRTDKDGIPEPASASTRSIDQHALSQWFEIAAQQLHIDIVHVETRHVELPQLIQFARPAVIRLGDDRSATFLAIVRGGRRYVTVLDPSQRIRRIPAATIRDALSAPVEQPARDAIQQMLQTAGVSDAQCAHVESAIVAEQLADVRIDGCFLLRRSPAATLREQIRHSPIPGLFIAVLLCHLIGVLSLVGSWAIIGTEGIEQHFDRASMWAWGLLLSTAIPFQLASSWSQNMLAMNVGSMFKQRLLYGTLQLRQEQVRHRGAGQFLGIVMESETLGSLALSGGLLAALAIVELAVGVFILLAGVGGVTHALLFVGWLAFTAWMCRDYYRGARKWIRVYRDLTNDLVERMVGYRTRLAQEHPDHWHDEENRHLRDYLTRSASLDRKSIVMRSVFVRGWLLIGLGAVLSTVVAAPSVTTEIAISIGGVVFTAQALNQLVTGLVGIVDAAIAWQEVGPVFQAASRTLEPSDAPVTSPDAIERSADRDEHPVLAADGLNFRYREHGALAVRECAISIHRGDRVLLQGPSGGGKSTLTALLGGLRTPESGTLRLWGFDRRETTDDVWRDRVVIVPQFHENYVLTETFAFNLLMGRDWPPRQDDLQQAYAVCQQLGLDALLERMPSGMQQIVGESGWTLSHGERSRLFIARALLQRADLFILDESFAALDPESLKQAMQCVLDRADTVLVIAHP